MDWSDLRGVQSVAGVVGLAAIDTRFGVDMLGPIETLLLGVRAGSDCRIVLLLLNRLFSAILALFMREFRFVFRIVDRIVGDETSFLADSEDRIGVVVQFSLPIYRGDVRGIMKKLLSGQRFWISIMLNSQCTISEDLPKLKH